jgi:hypothetical protein
MSRNAEPSILQGGLDILIIIPSAERVLGTSLAKLFFRKAQLP